MLDFWGSSNHLGSSKYHSKSLSKMRRKTDANNGMKDREQKLDESDSDAGVCAHTTHTHTALLGDLRTHNTHTHGGAQTDNHTNDYFCISRRNIAFLQ